MIIRVIIRKPHDNWLWRGFTYEGKTNHHKSDKKIKNKSKYDCFYDCQFCIMGTRKGKICI